MPSGLMEHLSVPTAQSAVSIWSAILYFGSLEVDNREDGSSFIFQDHIYYNGCFLKLVKLCFSTLCRKRANFLTMDMSKQTINHKWISKRKVADLSWNGKRFNIQMYHYFLILDQQRSQPTETNKRCRIENKCFFKTCQGCNSGDDKLQ